VVQLARCQSGPQLLRPHQPPIRVPDITVRRRDTATDAPPTAARVLSRGLRIAHVVPVYPRPGWSGRVAQGVCDPTARAGP
jgi:hypothetical protein